VIKIIIEIWKIVFAKSIINKMSLSNASDEFERDESKTPKQLGQGESGEPVADKPVGEGEEGAEPKEGEQIPVAAPTTEE